MVRTGKPWSIGSGWPFMATASIALRSSVSAARGVPQVQPSSEVWSTASAPSWTPASAQQVGDADAAPPGVADQVAADLVGHAVEGDPGLRAPTGEQLVVGQLHLVVDHAVDPQPPVARLDRRHHDRGVDQVEVVVRRLPRTDALEPDPRARRDRRLGDAGEPQQPAGLLHVPAAGADHPADARDHDRRQRSSTPARNRNPRRVGACRAGGSTPRRRRPRPPRPRPARPGAAARSAATGRSARWRSRRRAGGTPGSRAPAGSRRRRRRRRRARRTRRRAATSRAAPGGRRTRRARRGPAG